MAIIPETLKDALREKRVIPFIGAGVSRNVTDKNGNPLFPDWPTLLRNSIEKLIAEGEEAKADRVRGALNDKIPDYLEAAKFARDGLGAGWYDYLQKVFKRSRDDVKDESLEIARSCWALGSNLLITGNYENVLSWACPRADDPELWKIESIKEQVDLLQNNATTDFPTVWHLHGHISEPHNLIITPDGYAALYPENNKSQLEHKYKAALSILHTLLTIRPFLFIGFSMDDRQFEAQMKFVDELYEGISVKHYILLQKDSAKKFPDRDYLHPVTFENFAELPQILKELADIAADGKSVSTPTKSGPTKPGPPRSGVPVAKIPFNVPFRSKGTEFVGREGKPAEIRKALSDSNGVAIGQAVGIEGMGGLGKTQLAVEYAHEYRKEYPNGVIWFTADGDMEGQLRAIALESGWVNEFDKPENQLIVAHNILENLTDTLLIFDNVEKFEDIEPYLPKTDTNTHILATSRAPIAEFDVLNIDILNPEDSIVLLTATARRTLKPEDKSAVEKIVRDLDGLPLALEMAGAYLRMKPDIGFAVYAELLEKRISQALPPKLARAGFTKHEQDVFQTLSISEDIFAESPYLENIIDLLAWSGSSFMGLSLMSAILDAETIDLADALALGVSLSLLKKDADRYSIHRLLARVRREQTPLKDRKEWVGECAERLGNWFTGIKDDFTRLADFESEFEHLERWGKNTSEDFPGKAVRLIYLKAYPAYHRGKYKDAEKWTEIAYSEYEKRKLDDKNLLANILSDLGALSGVRGFVKKALEFATRALQIRYEVLGERHPDYAASLNIVGHTYAEMGDHKKALEYQQKALEIRREVLGENHPDYAASLSNVGNIYGEMGDYKKALEHQQRALEMQREVLGENHPNYATSLNNIGHTYGNLGDHKKALEYQQKALEIRKEVLGENHPDYATSLSNVGNIYGEMGIYKKALEHQQRALEMQREVLGENHPNYATSLNNVSVTYGNIGNHEKALEYQQKALEIRREVLGQKHPEYATSLNNLAVIYLKNGDAKNAKEYLEEAVSINTEIFGPNHPNTLIAKTWLDEARIALGGKEEEIRIQIAKRKKPRRKR